MMTECSGQTYDTLTHLCCDDNLVERPSNVLLRHQFCCADLIFDSQSQLCCQETLHVKSSVNHECCGSQVYNKMTHSCVDNTVVESSTVYPVDSTSFAPLSSTTVDPDQPPSKNPDRDSTLTYFSIF